MLIKAYITGTLITSIAYILETAGDTFPSESLSTVADVFR